MYEDTNNLLAKKFAVNYAVRARSMSLSIWAELAERSWIQTSNVWNSINKFFLQWLKPTEYKFIKWCNTANTSIQGTKEQRKAIGFIKNWSCSWSIRWCRKHLQPQELSHISTNMKVSPWKKFLAFPTLRHLWRIIEYLFTNQTVT